jgi:hypothetical protein
VSEKFIEPPGFDRDLFRLPFFLDKLALQTRIGFAVFEPAMASIQPKTIPHDKPTVCDTSRNLAVHAGVIS